MSTPSTSNASSASSSGGSGSDTIATGDKAKATGKRKAEATTLDEAAEDTGKQAKKLIVLCSSGVYGDELAMLETACQKLGASLVGDWSDAVTHLVMLKMSW